jgi:hypothetical protein
MSVEAIASLDTESAANRRWVDGGTGINLRGIMPT